MTRQEVYDKINYIIKNGKRRKDATLLDVLFYKKGDTTCVAVVEHMSFSVLSDTITVYQSDSPSEAIGKAIGRHANPDEMTTDDNNEIGNTNARLERL